jgi:pimeloyl-ACP methyl ester carboxylesterase
MKPNTVANIEDVPLTADNVELDGILTVPEDATGMVVFAHGSGSSRFSGRNHYVAQMLNDARLGTLLFDLLTAAEHDVDVRTRAWRFNIPLLAARLSGSIEWVRREIGLPTGLFGASTGAAAALIAAADNPDSVEAVVSRGGRPDLAGEALHRVEAPVLLIVGSQDQPVLEMNREAAAALRGTHRVEVVPGASHLFEEPGTLEHAAHLAQHWFSRYIGPKSPRDR